MGCTNTELLLLGKANHLSMMSNLLSLLSDYCGLSEPHEEDDWELTFVAAHAFPMVLQRARRGCWVWNVGSQRRLGRSLLTTPRYSDLMHTCPWSMLVLQYEMSMRVLYFTEVMQPGL